jgi:hypothetical protein
MQALQDQVTKLTAIIEELKTQTMPPTPPPPPAPDLTAPSAHDLAKQVEQVTVSHDIPSRPVLPIFSNPIMSWGG